jgi:hypothetical protein
VPQLFALDASQCAIGQVFFGFSVFDDSKQEAIVRSG